MRPKLGRFNETVGDWLDTLGMASRALQLSLGTREHLTHLRLAAALPPAPRWKPKGSGGGTGKLRYPDHAGHATTLLTQATALRAAHVRRDAVFGVDPELVLVMETNRSIGESDISALGRAEMQVLALAGDTAMVAFASDPELQAFKERCTRYAEGVPPGGKSAYYESFFDAIDILRPLQPSDVLDRDVVAEADSSPRNGVLLVDLQCWCPEDRAETERRSEATMVGHGITNAEDQYGHGTLVASFVSLRLA